MHFSFNTENFINSAQQDLKSILSIFSVPFSLKSEPLELHFSSTTINCPICFSSTTSNVSLNCGHFCCVDCFKDHIKYWEYFGTLSCFCCHCPLTPQNVKDLSGEEFSKKRLLALEEEIILADSTVRKCINQDCHMILLKKGIRYCNTIECNCGTRFCWECGRVDHAPLSCNNLKKWDRISNLDLSIEGWLSRHTQKCPKCKTAIEKNGHCIHMTCQNCKHEFCWNCFADWHNHPASYSCHVFKNRDNYIEDFDQIRFDFYDNMFIKFHDDGLKEGKEREAEQKKLSLHFIQTGMPKKDAEDFVDDIFHARTIARNVMKYSFPHAFFLKHESEPLEIFEHHQKNINEYLQKLVETIESLDSPPISVIFDLYNNLDAFLSNLLRQTDLACESAFIRKSTFDGDFRKYK